MTARRSTAWGAPAVCGVLIRIMGKLGQLSRDIRLGESTDYILHSIDCIGYQLSDVYETLAEQDIHEFNNRC